MAPRALGAGLLGLLAVSCVAFQSAPYDLGARKALTLGEARLRYEDQGTGSPVLLVHGFGSTLETWARTVPALEAEHRCIRVDLRGFGRSSKYAGDYSLSALAGDLAGLLDALGVERADVVAHSYGSSVALTLAREHPGRVGRVVLTDAFVYADQMPWYFAWARTPGVGELLFGLFYTQQLDWRIPLGFYDPGLATHDMVGKAREVLSLPGTRAAALAVVRGMGLEVAERGWAELDHPTLLVWGREDEVTPLAWGERLSRHLPRARLEVIPWAGHFPMLEAPETYNELLRAFLGDGA
jgi:pimeloyl-ACP methyl ester carboxylesterase